MSDLGDSQVNLVDEKDVEEALWMLGVEIDDNEFLSAGKFVFCLAFKGNAERLSL